MISRRYLFVLAFLEPGDHVRIAGQNGGGQARNVLRLELQVRGVEDENVAARRQVSGAQCVGDAAPGAMAREAKKRILLGQLLQHAPRAIGAAVVDDDDFVPIRRGCEGRGCLLHEQRQVVGFVLGRDQDGDVDLTGRGDRGSRSGWYKG
jgi:hypothetical protein